MRRADSRRRVRGPKTGILGLLSVSALCLALAPLVLDDSYSWIRHTTSEAGGQGVSGAWMARAGFLLFGFAVLWLSHRGGHGWPSISSSLHVIFGACLAGVAAFSLRSWDADVPFDHTEDLLHSIAATLMGFSFAFGVLTTRWTWGRPPRLRILDLVAITASVVLPLGMTMTAERAGLLQRMMFAIAYVWYGRETVALE